MSGGELSGGNLSRLKEAVRTAETESGLKFSLYLGAADGDPRAKALEMHATLADPERTVLVLCDPRLLSRGYGRVFLDSLPPFRRTRELADVQAFFARQWAPDAAYGPSVDDDGTAAPPFSLS